MAPSPRLRGDHRGVRPLRRVLVANRGEIAVRVIRACRDTGIESVAVYSDPDLTWPHVSLADAAYPLGGATAAETYLDVDKLIEIAKRARADAVHPGYGFLAENPAFAQACLDAGLIFVGPPPAAMRLLGSKTEARRVMQAAGVPVVPGTIESLEEADAAERVASEIGYPVALKAVAGGGGKGMRVVLRSDDLESAFRAAASEATAAFADGSLYLEKYLDRPRHVEVQILADRHGAVVHLGERECSVQRRHQKVIEESPSPAIDYALRERLGATAIQAARAAGYENAGTVEFLVDSAGTFYFLEVNARLQVEHPVTELVTGIDLVHEQLRLAAGEPLGYTQEAIQHRGAAIECRIYAEDPFNQFLPSIGPILEVRLPTGPGVRLDAALAAGLDVSVYYDPLLAKLCTWGRDRAEAIARMRRALSETFILGPRTNLALHHWMLERADFLSGDIDTGWLERVWPPEEGPESGVAVAAALVSEAQRLDLHSAAAVDGSRWRQAARVDGLRSR